MVLSEKYRTSRKLLSGRIKRLGYGREEQQTVSLNIHLFFFVLPCHKTRSLLDNFTSMCLIFSSFLVPGLSLAPLLCLYRGCGELIQALERQKTYTDAIRVERDELRDEVVQLKDILKVLEPCVSVRVSVCETKAVIFLVITDNF